VIHGHVSRAHELTGAGFHVTPFTFQDMPTSFARPGAEFSASCTSTASPSNGAAQESNLPSWGCWAARPLLCRAVDGSGVPRVVWQENGPTARREAAADRNLGLPKVCGIRC
jgi:hypothetical protein